MEGQTTPLRAYLATALTDLQAVERDRVFKVCEELKQVCAENGVALYLPFEHSDPLAHPDVPPAVVYETDRKKVLTSDLLFVLCTTASYGVGQENEIAADHGAPVVYLIQEGCKVSRMLLGSDTRNRTIEYAAAADLAASVREFLPETVRALTLRRERLKEPEPLGIGARIRELRERSNVSRTTLADLLGINENKLARLEEDPTEEPGRTVKQLRAVAAILNANISYVLLGATPSLDERMVRSRDNLKVVAGEEGMPYIDFERLWEGYLQRQREAMGVRIRDPQHSDHHERAVAHLVSSNIGETQCSRTLLARPAPGNERWIYFWQRAEPLSLGPRFLPVPMFS